MNLVNGFKLMEYAKDNGYTLPAFNTTNLEMTYAIADGIMEAGMPGFIQISSNNLRLSNPRIIAEIAKDAVKHSDVPIGLHLDHGKSFEDVKACCDAGFTSIMIDASHMSLEENIKICKKTTDFCHFYGIPVECELGALKGKEEDIINESECKTNPDMVAEFVEKTGCDTLAVSIGNIHGLCLEPKLDIDLLQRIHSVCKVPLVLHGGSGIPKEIIWECKKYGLIKINYGSDLRQEFIRVFGEAYEENHEEHDVIHLSMLARERVAKKAEKLVEMINANG